jgi:soluble lytic murein transglycosylase-like protein
MGTSQRSLLVLSIVGAIAAATPVSAETRPVRPGADRVAQAPNDAKYRRAAFMPTGRRRPAGDYRAYSREIADASARYAVPERLIWAVIRVESDFDHRAVSRKGARGLMQLMPATAATLGVRDVFDPRENIDGGTRHLRAMMMRFRYDVRLAVAAYNAGEGPVAAYRGVPPFPETRDYVAQVLRFYEAPGEWQPTPVRDVQRFVQPNGTIVYTNIPYGQLTALGR